MKTIIISPIFNQYFAGRIWMGLDVAQLKSYFTQNQFNSEIIPFENIFDSLDQIDRNAVIFYSSIYNETYLQYIKDTIIAIRLIRPDITVLPNFEQLNSLDNKGFQELYKKHLQIDRVYGKYYGDVEDFKNDPKKLSYPLVLKKNKGALSSGVSLIHKKQEMELFFQNEKKLSLKQRLAFKLNKRNSFKKDANLLPNQNLLEKNFSAFFGKKFSFVTQQFVPALGCDYKVLIFGDKYYCLERKTRNNDFRASGSGNFSFVEPPLEILNYARELNQKFQVPFISLDLGIDADKVCYLFEYQGTGFGPMTLTQSTYYYKFDGISWTKNQEVPDLEREYTNAIVHFLKHTADENS